MTGKTEPMENLHQPLCAKRSSLMKVWTESLGKNGIMPLATQKHVLGKTSNYRVPKACQWKQKIYVGSYKK